MSVRVCTLMWGDAWKNYGSIFAETYLKHWDPKIEISVVTDRELPLDRAQQLYLHNLKDYLKFHSIWIQSPVPPKIPADGRNLWKWDSHKWLPQVITPKAVLEKNTHWVDGDILVWMDADCEFYADVNEEWIEKVLGDAECCALQRPGLHTEIGFYAIRLSPKTRNALNRFANLFTSFDIFDYDEWHSAYAWDIAMKENDIQIKNLNTTLGTTHVFPLSVLAEKINHKKGHRKPGGG